MFNMRIRLLFLLIFLSAVLFLFPAGRVAIAGEGDGLDTGNRAATVIVGGKTPTGEQPLAPSIVTRSSDNPPGSPPVAVTTVTRGEDARRMTIVGLLARARVALDALIPFIIGLAVFVILWGIFLYVTKAAEEEKRSEGRLYIVWGIVAVFSMLSLWGFVNILVNTFDLKTTLDKSSIPTAPTL